MNSKTEIHTSYDEQLPTWALSLAFNGDMSGLEDEEVRLFDNWERRFLSDCNHYHISIDNDAEEYFSAYPAFGLACNVMPCVVHCYSY